MKSNVLWSLKSTDIKSFYFDLRFSGLDDFSILVLSNLNFGNTYSILIRVEYNEGKYGMLGPQIGFKLDTVNYMTSIKLIHNIIMSRIEHFSDYYNVEFIDSVQILFVKVNIQPKLMIQNVNSVDLTNKGVNVRDVKSKYKSNFLPLTTDTNYFGKLVTDNSVIDIYINKFRVFNFF